VFRAGWGKGGEMTQALYAHMKNKTIKKNKHYCNEISFNRITDALIWNPIGFIKKDLAFPILKEKYTYLSANGFIETFVSALFYLLFITWQ
jgi:hypothetical protein